MRQGQRYTLILHSDSDLSALAAARPHLVVRLDASGEGPLIAQTLEQIGAFILGMAGCWGAVRLLIAYRRGKAQLKRSPDHCVSNGSTTVADTAPATRPFFCRAPHAEDLTFRTVATELRRDSCDGFHILSRNASLRFGLGARRTEQSLGGRPCRRRWTLRNRPTIQREDSFIVFKCISLGDGA